MPMEQTACEDLKAFERRLQEMINCLQPQTNRYRLLLFLSTLCTTIGVFQWLTDPLTPRISLISSLLGHPFFTLNVILLILLFALTGIHKKVVEPQIIMSRVRQVLANFNMSCDDSGRLILKPRPSPR